MKILKKISTICSIIGFVLGTYGLIVSVGSIGAAGFAGLGIIFIIPSLFALTIITFDYLISADKIKGGLLFSYISTLIKIGVIIGFIPLVNYNYKYEMEFGYSNLPFDLLVIVLVAIIAIPSILNIIKLSTKKNK